MTAAKPSSRLRVRHGRTRGGLVSIWKVVLVFWFGTVAWPQSVEDLTPDQWIWAVKSETSVLLHSVPDYACLESIAAKSFGGDRLKPDLYETAQVEIAFIGGQEWYSLPSERRFSSAKLSKLIDSVFATTGLYSSLPRGLMGASAQGLEFISETELGGERVGLFHFDKPTSKPSWVIQLNGRRAMAFAQGSFWASAKTLLLKGVSVSATQIQPDIGLKSLHVNVQYDVQSLREKRVLLPTSAQIWARETDGKRYVSDVLFTHCRAYQAESSLSFGDQRAATNTPAQPLPPGIPVTVELAQRTDWSSISARQTLVSTVTRPVSWKGQIVIPAGAVLEGSVERVRWLPEYEVFQIVFEFDKLKLSEGTLPFYGRVLSVSPSDGIQRAITELDRVQARSRLDARRESATLPDIIEPDASGLLTVYMKGKSSFLPKGLKIQWHTE